ncbi:hypothetical protein [Bradyrhizobium iriomotense]|uniref:hypothetical protein n=1 Tax=Bradyrhizobium iriomotense TaxID=441950 RepID=UPI001B8A54A1|nr:hypothetical protein [Bradyrhizobium iriomotense]MBR1129486.1 hypothetical protein [Bradyrhizobium iriomotense]
MSELGRAIEFRSVSVRSVGGKSFRLDASFYRGDFANASKRLISTGLATRKIADIARAFVPGRTRLVTTKSAAAGAPYLRAHDAFDIRPRTSRFVSKGRTKNYDELLLEEGMILTPSSGRNLGPMAYVGRYLSGFAMTDIMRIVPESRSTGFYLLAYLLTPTAQTLIRRGRSGTTVDHLSPNEVLDLHIPWLEDDVRESLASDMMQAEQMINEGRSGLDEAATLLHEKAGMEYQPPNGKYLSRDCGDAFSLSSRYVGTRLDAASFDPSVRKAAEFIKNSGGATLGDVAELKTLDRYIRYYVEAPNGRPVLSGRQMLQARPVNLKHISDRSFKDPTKFVLKAGSTIFTCDGRSEEALGEPAYVMPIWDGWMASEHVMRVEPKAIGPGYLYLCLSSPWVQRQLKARATGSVIDALEPEEIEQVVLPMLAENERKKLDEEAVRCWTLISDGVSLSKETASRFEHLLHPTN